MCMGYAKEIKAWVCQTEQNQRDEAMVAWGEAFSQDTTFENASEMPLVKDGPSLFSVGAKHCHPPSMPIVTRRELPA